MSQIGQSKMSKNIAEAFASLSVTGRNPSWAEYKAESPAGQRAIERRWLQLWGNSEGAKETTNKAFYRWHRAMFGPHVDDPEAQRDFGIDSSADAQHSHDQAKEEGWGNQERIERE